MMRLKITSQVRVFLWLLALGLMLGNHLSPKEGWAADTTYYAGIWGLPWDLSR